jgi:penicillin-binding protein 2
MTAIGQGDIELTPISLARATMMLANKGFNHQLHFTKDHEHIMSTPQIEASDQNWRRIHDAMEAVTKTGTARAFAQSSYPIAGKTGSAQVKSIKTKAEYKTLPKHQKDHHLFIGFSPIENPQVALVVITEHEHQAVKTAKHMLDFYWQNHTNHDAN